MHDVVHAWFGPGPRTTSPTNRTVELTTIVVGIAFRVNSSEYETSVSVATQGLSTTRSVTRVIPATNLDVVIVVNPPAVQGLGAAGGFKLMLEDRAELGPQVLAKAANDLAACDRTGRDLCLAVVRTSVVPYRHGRNCLNEWRRQ